MTAIDFVRAKCYILAQTQKSRENKMPLHGRRRHNNRFPRHIIRLHDGNRYARRSNGKGGGFTDSRRRLIPLQVIADIMLEGHAEGYITNDLFVGARARKKVRTGA